MGQLSPKLRYAFYIFNIVYFVMGVSMIGVGIYNIIALNGFGVFARNVYVTGGVLFLIAGMAKIVISVIGIIGMATGKKIVLIIYTIFTLLAILPTLIAGVFGLQQWFFVFNDVGEVYNQTFTNQGFTQIQQIQQNFENQYYCCGVEDGMSDYTSRGINYNDTGNCERAKVFRIYNNTGIPRKIGCQYYVSDAIRGHLYYIGSIGLAYGFFEVLAAIVAMQNTEGH